MRRTATEERTIKTILFMMGIIILDEVPELLEYMEEVMPEKEYGSIRPELMFGHMYKNVLS